MDAPEPTAAVEKILIIDDEEGLRSMLKFGLKKRGYEVFTAEDGEHALKLVGTHIFDLAICDIMMPGMDGVQVLKALKEKSPTTEVIMATGYATLETAIESMKQGAFDYITKPYSLGTLCAAFEKANEHRKLKAKINHLEELDRLKDEFITTLNHELRTPLASVMGYISLMRQGVYGMISDQQRDVMNRAELNSKYLLQLINSILDFSKLQANRLTLNPETFPLKEVLQEVAAVMEPLAAEKTLAFAADCPEDMFVLCDRMRLRQILLNLTGNAIKFTNTGSVTIQVNSPADEDELAFRISDTGIGISAEHLPLLFQEFRQVDGSLTRAHNGTGLGLAISKRLAEKMGGNIVVQSKIGVGSVFLLTLPIRKDMTSLPTADTNLPLDPSVERIVLAIDDDPDMLKLIADGVNGSGFRVVTAQSGAEGLALARRVRPDCIALDLLMPHMDGWQVLHNLKNDPTLKHIPVYIVSMVDEQARAFAMGVAGYMQKPLKRDELIAQLALVQRKTHQVMVVDDDSAIRDVLTSALCAEGYEVVPLATGEEALGRLKTLQPDVLFLDLFLPGVSGFDILAALDELPNREKVAIFIMTGKELTQDEQKFLSRRSQMVILKGNQTIPELIKMLKDKLPPARAAA